jgi:putative nucleotidyltransferase with HDIG domain
MFNSSSPPPYSKKIKQILGQIDRLKPLPATSRKIMRIVENPQATADQVIRVIKTDQALAADVIRMANSASLGYRVPCNSIETGVVRIGFKRVRALALRSFASGPLTQRLNGYRMKEKSLWQHSLETAVYSEYIAREIAYSDPEDAYVAGLLHDIGKLLLDQYVLGDYQKITRKMAEEKKPLWMIEEELFGIDHAVIGGMMVEKWKLPSKLAEGIRFHHMPTLAKKHQVLVTAVHVANGLTSALGSDFQDQDGKVISDESLDVLGLSEDRFAALQERLRALTVEDGELAG